MCEALPQAHEFASAHVDIAFLLRNLRLHVEKRNADWRYFRPHLEHAAPEGGKSGKSSMSSSSTYFSLLFIKCVALSVCKKYIVVCTCMYMNGKDISSTIVFHSISIRESANLAANHINKYQ